MTYLQPVTYLKIPVQISPPVYKDEVQKCMIVVNGVTSLKNGTARQPV